MSAPSSTRAVAIIGAGASGAITAAAFASEGTFGTVRVFERRETPGGTWIYDTDPHPPDQLYPGKLPPDVDPRLDIPKDGFPTFTAPSEQQRFDKTPIYSGLTTNVPEIAMSFSDHRFAYGPFVPHWIPKQYVQDYFSLHGVDDCLVLNTTVEDVSRAPAADKTDQWQLTLRRYDPIAKLDIWWRETFDAVVIANGHYSVPYIPQVEGLEDYMKKFPGRVTHSKSYRSPSNYLNKRILIIGNSASGHDITTLLSRSGTTNLPIYQSRRSRSRWDGEDPPPGISWKPTIRSYNATNGAITFTDDTTLTGIDAVIYCTGYKPSYPFWNTRANGNIPLYDYAEDRLTGFYQHTFSTAFPFSIGIVGIPRVLTFRSFEYQAVALARLFSYRTAKPLPPPSEMAAWEAERAVLVKRERRPFHAILWDNGETREWFRYLFEFSGLPVLEGKGRFPPVFDAETRWAYDHIKKYPEPEKGDADEARDGEWELVERVKKDSTHFI